MKSFYALTAVVAFCGCATRSVDTGAYAKLLNDARYLAASSSMHMLESGEDAVRFDVDPTSGSVSGPLTVYLKSVSPGTEVVDGMLEVDGTFSLRRLDFEGGREVVFDVNGRPVTQ